MRKIWGVVGRGRARKNKGVVGMFWVFGKMSGTD